MARHCYTYLFMALMMIVTLNDAKRELAKCLYGRYKGIAAASCREVLDVQPSCYGQDGFYWIKEGTDVRARYCDMSYKGGGWKRIYNFDSTRNSSCNGTIENTSNSTFNNVTTYGPYYSSEYYCGSPSNTNLNCAYIKLLKTDKEVGLTDYTEIRGYVNIRLKKDSGLVGYTGWPSSYVEFDICTGYMSGLQIYTVYFDDYGGKQLYPTVLYLVTNPSDPADPSTSGCPATTTAAQSTQFIDYRVPYRIKGWQCDEYSLSDPDDSEGIFEKDFFSLDTCSQCDDSGKWFQRRYATPVSLDEIIISFSRTSTNFNSGALYFSSLTLFIR